MADETELEGGSTAAEPAALDAPEAVRNTPEYQAVLRQNRDLARKLGTEKKRAEEARLAAEQIRLAAEAEREAARAAQVRDVLGDDGLAAYSELADLTATDPLAGAKAFRELLDRAMQSGAATRQSTATQVQQTATANATSEAHTVPETPAAPPPPSSGIDVSAPLGAATSGEDFDTLVTDLESDVGKVIEQNQNPMARNRVTEAIRREALMKYLGAAYIKAGAAPKSR